MPQPTNSTEEELKDLETRDAAILATDTLEPTNDEKKNLYIASANNSIPYGPYKAPESGRDEADQDDEFTYSAPAAQSLSGKLLRGKYAPSLVAKAGIAMLSRNKGKATLGATGIIGLFLIASYGTTLSLVHATNMAEDRLNGGMEVLADEREGKIAAVSKWLARRNLIKQTRLQSNSIRLSRAIEARGYTFLEDGRIQTPPGDDGSPRRILNSLSEAEEELGQVMRDEIYAGKYRGVRYRNKVVNRMLENLNVGRTSILSRIPLEGEEGLTKRQKITRRIRKAQFDRADGVTIDSFKEAQDDVKKVAGDDADEATDNLNRATDDPDYTPPANTELQNLRANTPDARRAFQGSVDSLVSNSGTIARASAAADVANIVCRIGQAAVAGVTTGIIIKRWNLINLAGITFANRDSIISGDVDTDLVNEYYRMIETSDGGKDWMQSSGMLWLRGEDVNPAQQQLDAIGLGRPDVGGVLGFMAKLFAIGGVAAACGVATNTGGQIAIALTEFAVLVASTIATAPAGGSGGAAVAGGSRATASLISRQVARGAGIALAVEFGAGYGEGYIQAHLTNLVSGQIAQIEDAGGELKGNLVAAGLAAFFEHQGMNTGGRPLTATAYFQQEQKIAKRKRQMLAKMSLNERLFSVRPSHTSSLTTYALAESDIRARNPIETIHKTIASITNLKPLTQIQKFASSKLTEPTLARSANVIVDKKGYVRELWGSYILGNDLSNIHPGKNLESLTQQGEISQDGEPIGKNIKKYLDDCTQLDMLKPDADEVKDICVKASSKPYQAYLADMHAASTVDAFFNPVIAVEASNNSKAPPAGNAGDDTSALSCPKGTEDGGVQQDYGPNRVPTVKIRICGIPGAIPKEKGINASTAANALRMINAAKADGITLTGSAFRSYDRQKELRIQHGCPDDSQPSSTCRPPTAKPGSSLHEVGLAIDFSTYSFSWLSQNAGRFGFKNLPSEAWHWSTTGN